MRRLCCVVLLLVSFVTGCSGPKSADLHEPLFTIGMPGPHSSTRPYHLNARSIVEAAGGAFVAEPYDLTPEGNVRLVENLIQNGSDGIILFPTSDQPLAHIAKLCEEAGVYWVIHAREIRDPRIKQRVEESPYFVGMVAVDEESLGYDVTEVLGRQGIRKMAVFTTGAQDTTGAARMRGMSLAALEYGIEVVEVIRNPQNAQDVTNAVESLLRAHPDLGAFLNLGTFFSSASTVILSALREAGKSGVMKFAAIDFDPGMDVFFDEGMISIAFGGISGLTSALAATLLVNALVDPLDNAPITLHIDPLKMHSGDELRRYFDLVENGTGIFSHETANQKLFKWKNPDITVESLQEIINDYSIDAVLRWRE